MRVIVIVAPTAAPRIASIIISFVLIGFYCEFSGKEFNDDNFGPYDATR